MGHLEPKRGETSSGSVMKEILADERITGKARKKFIIISYFHKMVTFLFGLTVLDFILSIILNL